jgi:hypothetical protein
MLCIMLNPLSVLFKPSRWWLVKSIGKLLISGLYHVEVCVSFPYAVAWANKSSFHVVHGFLDGVRICRTPLVWLKMRY